MLAHKSPFGIGNRILRVLWKIVYILFFRYSFRTMHHWRIALLKCFGAKISMNCRVYPTCKIWAPWNLICEAYSCIGDEVIIYNQGLVYLEKEAVVSQKSYLCTGTHDYTKRSFPLITKSIRIKEKAWICTQTFIHPGVTVGEGCVIGACSVVTQDMPDWMVCAGNPCKPIKKRAYL
jgi:putative colanic acid biosynthesis acetyltransferase WcaF